MLESHPLSAGADRNLLFGILALQMDFIKRDALIAAMHAWVLDKAKPLGQILLEQKQLSRDRLLLLDAMVGEHVKAHGGDAQRSMAALSAVSWIRKALADVADPDVDASIACLPGRNDADPYATRITMGGSAVAGARYRILRPHAKGNLGEVFVAQDAELHREVALKEIQGYHADHPETRARFILEAEITGGLEHPGIVPVYGLGTYADGRPYYAMRFIKGDNLREAIERFHERDVAGRHPGERHLSYLQLLRRFIDVCNAVGYAHARGILHRDLKPGNIMLGKYGETLVVDWGLAKPVGRADLAMQSDEKSLQPNSGSGAAMTQAGMVVGTPAYMSPEQASGQLDQLGVASDVYSLGATLHSVLTGKSPVAGENAVEVLHRVQCGEITPPRQIKKRTPAALEAVCLKAMAFKPEERYKSALALAADVEHWLADEPVAAYPERRWQRGRRWLRRHRTLATSAAATLMVAVLLLSGAAVLLNSARQDEKQARLDEQAQRKEAEKQVQQRAAVVDLLVKWFRRPDPSVDGREVKVVEVLEDALIELEHGAVDDDVTTARLVEALGQTFHGLGLPSKAIPLHERARRLRSQALGLDHPDTLASMNDLALAYQHGGQLAEALELFKETLELRKAQLGAEHGDTLVSTSNLGLAYLDLGRLNEALPLFEETLQIRKATLGLGHSDTLVSMNELALAYHSDGRLSEALILLEETFRLNKETVGAAHPHTLVSMNNVARAYQANGRLAEAVPLYEKTLDLRKAKLGPDHRSTLVSMNNLATAYADSGRHIDAIPLYEETLRLSKVKLGPDHPGTLTSMNNLAGAFYAVGRVAEALPLYEATVKLSRVKLGTDHPNTVITIYTLARTYHADDRLSEALPLYEEVLNVKKAKFGLDHPDTVLAMTRLARCLLQQGKFEQAAPHLRAAVSFHENTQPDDWQHYTTQSLLGAAMTGQRKFKEAEPLLLSGYEGLRSRQVKIPSYANRELPNALDRIIELYDALEKPDKAVEWRAKRDETKQAAERLERLRLAVGIVAGWPVVR